MRPLRIPLAIKIPAVVIVFMAAVAVFASERVLTKLQEAQARHLGDLATVYLDGLASAVVDPVVREDVWEIFDVLDRTRQVHAGLRPAETVVATVDGHVLASSDPRSYPSGSALPSLFLTEQANAPAVAIRDLEGKAVSRRDLSSGGRAVGSIHATFDIAPLLAERRAVLLALIASNAALTLGLALTAWLTVRRMMRPVRVLASHLERGTETAVEPIPSSAVTTAPREFRNLFAAFNRMAEAVRERETLSRRLAEDERLASLGRLASGMAHEINNPLGGLFAAIDTLKQHGERSDVRRRTIDLIDRGLRGIRDVVRTTLVTYRADRGTGFLRRADIDDLRLLIEPMVHRESLTLNWSSEGFDDIPVSPSVTRQVLLNLLLNACQATPGGGEVSFAAAVEGSRFVALIGDTGPGMPDAARDVLTGMSEHAPSADGSGLGLWMVRRLLKDVRGTISVTPGSPQGTKVRVSIPFTTEEDLADVA